MEKAPEWVEIKNEVEDFDIKQEPLEHCVDHSVSLFDYIFQFLSISIFSVSFILLHELMYFFIRI